MVIINDLIVMPEDFAEGITFEINGHPEFWTLGSSSIENVSHFVRFDNKHLAKNDTVFLR